jgi:hypothetical protein
MVIHIRIAGLAAVCCAISAGQNMAGFRFVLRARFSTKESHEDPRQ